MRCFSLLLVLFGFVAFILAQQYDYADALEKSILFYEAQRSGVLPANNRIPWRGDSALDDEVPQGYYDAGDHVKFGFPLAFTITQLAWGAISYQSGYESAGQLEYMKDCLKWGTDYLIAAHVSKFEFFGQVGDGDIDHTFWGKPEDMTMPRPAFKITQELGGSELAGESAAALAASSIFYRNINDTTLADEALSHARDLFEFADVYRGNYIDAMPSDGYYTSSGYEDELIWAACWMFKATGEQDYLDKAEEFFTSLNQNYPSLWGQTWENKLLGAHVLLYELTGKAEYANLIEEEAFHYLYTQQRTPLGLMYIYEWGSIRSSLNTMQPLMHLADIGYMTNELREFARSQLDYALGSTGRSFVVGFGVNPPQQPHHRGASCPDMPEPCGDAYLTNPDPNPHVLYGALVGGPDFNDNYHDNRSDYVQNEVALDYNCGFQSVLAGMIQLDLNEN